MSGTTVIALIAATISPVVAYLIAARQFSGKIETSNAADLWNESKNIREWAMQRIRSLESTVNTLEGRVRELEKHSDSLAREKRQLERDLARCQETH
jgi:predicted RNase H-like nuclease (RuvC/YqgF family)